MCTPFAILNANAIVYTVNLEIFAVKIFPLSSLATKIKHGKKKNPCVYYNANAYGKGSPPTKIKNLPHEIFSMRKFRDLRYYMYVFGLA